MKICHSCRRTLDLGREIGRRDLCSFCKADLHCCLNCRFHDSSAPRQCREPQAEPVREKDKANYCDYFVFAEQKTFGSDNNKSAQAREALNELFKK